MRVQQVSVDVWKMLVTAASYLGLVYVLWIFLRLVNACIWLPGHLKKQNELEELELLRQELDDQKKEDQINYSDNKQREEKKTRRRKNKHQLTAETETAQLCSENNVGNKSQTDEVTDCVDVKKIQ